MKYTELEHRPDGTVVEVEVWVRDDGTETRRYADGPLRAVPVKLPWAQYCDVLDYGAAFGLDTASALRSMLALGVEAARDQAERHVQSLTGTEREAADQRREKARLMRNEAPGGLRVTELTMSSGAGSVDGSLGGGEADGE